MRKIVCMLALFLLLGNIHAQGLEIGVYTEPQVAWITSDEGSVVNEGSVIHLNSGLRFDMFFTENYAFTLGIEMNNLGGKLTYGDTLLFQQNDTPLYLEVPAGTTMKHNLQYLGLPLGLKLKTTEMGYTTLYFHTGLLPQYNIKAVTSSDALDVHRETIKPEINVFNLNYFVSGGIEYRLAGNTAIVAGFKWTSGFNDVTKNDFANNNIRSAGLHLGIIF